jgi:chemotaxis protein methyltransferase WspC
MAEFEIHAREGAVVYRLKDEEAAPGAAGARIVCQAGPPRPIEPLELVDPPAARQPGVVPAPAPPAANVPSPTESALDWREAWRAARASANQGQLELAEWYCQQAIATAQLRPEPHYLFGTLRQASGDDEAALAAFRRALYVDPTFAPALLGQAAIQRRGGAEERARHALLRAQRLLNGRQADEWILAEEGLTVGRLRDAVAQALGNEGLVA